jgi:hypothetical protein
MATLHRDSWNGHPVPLGTTFQLTKRKSDHWIQMVCTLQSHQWGWELVLEVNGVLARSQVCRSRDEVLTVSDDWHAAMMAAGWSEAR